MMSIDELAEKYGHKKAPKIQGDSPYSAVHAYADVSHGWSRFAMKHGKCEIAEHDYIAAIEASKKGKTHGPANKRVS